MPRYAYVNGRYTPHDSAQIHIEDRGYQLADGVYEVIACIHGHLADEQGHLDRLERSLHEIGMNMPRPRNVIQLIMRELLRRNRLTNAAVYIQVTRGVAKRDFPFPPAEIAPSLVMTARPFRFDHNDKITSGIKVVTVPDQRWKRRDIKTIALLPQVLAKQKAAEQGAYEAWMVDDDGYVTEGASSNSWIVNSGGTLITRNADCSILRGVTRTALDKLGRDMGLVIEERRFTPGEAYQAVEAFNTSAVALIAPVVEIDGHKIGTGKPGPVAERLYREYMAYVEGLRGKAVPWSA